jgi:hypothetical protein
MDSFDRLNGMGRDEPGAVAPWTAASAWQPLTALAGSAWSLLGWALDISRSPAGRPEAHHS